MLFSFALSSGLSAQTAFCGFVTLGDPVAVPNTTDRFTVPVSLQFSDETCFSFFQTNFSIAGVNPLTANIAITTPNGVDITSTVSSVFGTFALNNSNTAANIGNGVIVNVAFTAPQNQCITITPDGASGISCTPEVCDGPGVGSSKTFCNGLTVSGSLYSPVPGAINAELPAITVRTNLPNIAFGPIYDGTTSYNTVSSENRYVSDPIPQGGELSDGNTRVRLATEVGTPYVDDLCGVSTADIILVTDIILARDNLSGWQRVACDADQNGTINVIDITRVRQEILGFAISNFDLQLAFPTPEDLLALDAESILSNNAAITGTYEYAPLGMGRDDIDFAAVKLGDPSGSWPLNCPIISNPEADNLVVKALPTIINVIEKTNHGTLVEATIQFPSASELGVLGLDFSINPGFELVNIISSTGIEEGVTANFDRQENRFKILLSALDFKKEDLDAPSMKIRLEANANITDFDNIFKLNESPLENVFYNAESTPHKLTIASLVSELNMETDVSLGFDFFPNPAQNLINVVLPVNLKKNSILEISNLHGQIVTSMIAPAASTTATMDVSDLPKGIYILRLNLEDDISVSRKFIKL
jgi:hypothetical protein